MEKTPDGKVLLTEEEYKSLKDDQTMLVCLQACGVDNWEGYDDAVEAYERSVGQ